MTRSGFIALLGAPNAGKSTLLNRLIGQSLAAVTSRPQTTHFPIPAILTRGEVQYIFVDTPGWIAQPRYAWHQALTAQSLATAREADIQVWVLSLTSQIPLLPEGVEAFLRQAPALIGAFTHADLLSDRITHIHRFQADLAHFPFQRWIDVSLDQSLEPFLEALALLLPQSPFLYPTEQLTPLPIRFFVAEILREVLYTHLREEVPYSTEVEVVQYKEGESSDYIAANIYVEKESQKRIVIGQKGSMIKNIGKLARRKIEEILQKHIYLELYVKVRPSWRRSILYLRNLGYRTS
ncbi:MAG: GTPase Era [Bacteroidia bacterium]|nr:GTPase Era [Bacteroidia bacterium]MDW8015348.1 GTPase Era [Bacteroidia bacterium]